MQPTLASAMVLFILMDWVACGGLATVLPLTRVHTGYPVGVDQLRAWDGVRHTRLLQTVIGGGVNMSTAYDHILPQPIGLYLTKVKLGSPPREFTVLLDTGSDLLWIPCTSCGSCPRSSELGIPLNFYDPPSSSTARLFSCSEHTCPYKCSRQSQECEYRMDYADGDHTSGYLVSDEISFDMLPRQFNSSATVVFGCSTEVYGLLANPRLAYSGIFGFGRADTSVISQLSSQGLTSHVFSHCLKGDELGGGGLLVLGEVLEPSIVYTPLVPSSPHYGVDLQSIAVNGQILPIDRSVFSTSNERGAFFDSGTCLAYLEEEAYHAFVTAINLAVSRSVTIMNPGGIQYYVVYTSLAETFPPISLNFAGGVSMLLTPHEYLLYSGSYAGGNLWSIGFQISQYRGYTILGDILLKNKIIVYDLERQQLGWANHDCSSAVNITVTVREDRRKRHGSDSSSLGYFLFKLVTPVAVVALLM